MIKPLTPQFRGTILESLNKQSKENEYDLAKKLKLKHKTFENIIELENFVNKRIIHKSNIINIQYIQNRFKGCYVLFYFK